MAMWQHTANNNKNELYQVSRDAVVGKSFRNRLTPEERETRTRSDGLSSLIDTIDARPWLSPAPQSEFRKNTKVSK